VTAAVNPQQQKSRTLLGFDFGLKRIGVAVGQELTGTASALTTVRAVDGKPDWEAISRLIEQWRPDAIVVGLPLNMDGTYHDLSYLAKRFGNQLAGRYNLRAYFMDERLSSLEAEHLLKTKSGKVQAEEIDKVAARVILESWLAQQHTPSRHDSGD
jgi:putative Holliday junction resolvase